ncbi:putative transcription factor & lipid binding HD-SAD family [Helianthus annuus]|nr:putative transcription factor & lipid binding HD-SAD family [Helianthus annuus]KAJ0830220.1 putative transcription factor & lipid binding HD-SAD family [Helianthus annuus]
MYQPNMFENLHHHPLGTPENNLDMLRDEDHDSNMEAPSGDDQDPNQRRNKKKRYHRHTQHQIQELEAFFKECPHPDDKQRKDLGRRLSLEPLQVKFWFQNKRTQMKAQHERYDNTQLRNENEKLRAENMRLKEVLANVACPNCGGPAAIGEMSYDEQQLRVENTRLREEIDRLSGIAAKYVGRPMLTYPDASSHGPSRTLDLPMSASFNPQQGMVGETFGANDHQLLQSMAGPTEKPVIIELAIAAMEELIRMAQVGEPLWVPVSDESSQVTLNEEEYQRSFPRGIGPKPMGLKSEASRESTVVIMNHIALVEVLMDANQWSNVFCGIVSRAMTLEVLSTGVAGSYNGAMQVMVAEYQVPSPLIATRENYFVRYCKQLDDGTWVVVDVSLDNLRSSSVVRCRRRPSGCLIQELPDGYSNVTWVEHVEVDNGHIHDIYKVLVNSGLAFGAKRWVASLERQCERLANAMANNLPTGEVGVMMTLEGRKSMLKLAQRMVLSYCCGVGASSAHTWTTLSGTGLDDVRIMTRKNVDDPGRPTGLVLSAATSFWLPVPPRQSFNYLHDENTRGEWDPLLNSVLVQEIVHIPSGRDPGNCVSLLRVNSANSIHHNMIMLQESLTDSTGSYVVYAPIDVASLNVILSGGDPDYVALLPSGFAILPDGPGQYESGVLEVGTGGSIITTGLQILFDSAPTAKLSLGSVTTVNTLIKCTTERIKCALAPNNL